MLIVLSLLLFVGMVTGKGPEWMKQKFQKVDVDRFRKAVGDFFRRLEHHSKKVGRALSKPLLQLYYVAVDEKTPTMDRVIVFGCLLYVVLPVSLIPRRVFRMLGWLDEAAALAVAIRRVRSMITPEIDQKVITTLNEWFGEEAAC